MSRDRQGRIEFHGPPPARVGSFEIISLIGRGGMGCVYRARDRKLGRLVALKRPRPDLVAESGFRQRFMREARAASKLMHPHITAVFEVFEDDSVPWLAMELVDGMSLRARLERPDRMSIVEIVSHAESIAGALEAAHSSHILHRDINPNNVLIGRDGRAKLTDFGLAKAFFASGADPGASTESVPDDSIGDGAAGTRGYMSPEQALGKKLDPRSDIFSFGLLLYEMCAGSAAFPADSDDWLDALLHHEPRPISDLNYEVPNELARIIRKAIAKRPDERYQEASDLVADIRTLRRRLESDPLVQSGSDHLTPKPTRWGAVLSASAVAVVAISIAIRVVIGQHEESDFPFFDWTSRQLTSETGWEAEPAISSDGSLIAYSSNKSGNVDIWLIDVVGGSHLPLTDDAATDRDPAWFPDGGWVAFVSDRSGLPSVWKVPRLGGSLIQLVENAEDPAISADGKRIAFARKGPTGTRRIFVARVDDPANAVLVSGQDSGLWDHRDPAWAQDGNSLCFADARNLWLVNVDGENLRRLTRDHASDGEPTWFSGSSKIVFSSMREGSFALWLIDSDGGSPQRVTLGNGPEREPSLAHQGNRLAFSTRARARDVVVLDVNAGLRYRLPGVRTESTPIIAPDRASVVFVSNRMGKFDLWIQQLKDVRPVGEARRLTDHPGSVATPRFSPDGKRIAYHRVVDSQRDIWTLSLPDGQAKQFSNHPAMDVNPAFSPDGSMLAFVSDRSGIEHVWIAPIVDGEKTGEPFMLTDGDQPDFFPDWSTDGSRVAFVRAGEVWISTIGPEPSSRQLTEGAQASIARWDTNGDTLLVSGAWQSRETHLRRVSTLDGLGESVDPPVVFGDAGVTGLFGVSIDSEVIAYIDNATAGDLWLMEKKPHDD